ncbi:MAG: hypothetical protein AAB486_00035 [Patescibacteria group bacterium]
MKTIKEILEEKLDRGFANYVNHEFQDYGLRLCQQLEDIRHRSLYIKLAKDAPRNLLEKAKEFALGYNKPKSKGKIFMWKLKELMKETLAKTSQP